MPVTTSRILPKALALVAPFLLFALTCGVAPGSAYAQREHRVRSGQTLSQIARRYRVTVSSLAGANHLQLRSTIRPGRVLRVPDPGEIFVMRGQSLSQIARQHHTTVQALIRTNRLSASSVLTAGQRLMVPGAERRQTRQWGRPRTPGVVTLVRGGTSERIRIRLVDRRGRTRPAALRVLRRLMRHRSGVTRTPHRRLPRLLTRISDHFGGRPIHIMSGVRPVGGFTRASSRHVAGKAIDLRVQGVPNTAVRDYCRRLPAVGVGFYPNSSFVHVDTRKRRAYWVDYSRPGEAPQYDEPGGETARQHAHESAPSTTGVPGEPNSGS